MTLALWLASHDLANGQNEVDFGVFLAEDDEAPASVRDMLHLIVMLHRLGAQFALESCRCSQSMLLCNSLQFSTDRYDALYWR